MVGFLVTSQRQDGVFKPEYLPVYRELEARGLPLGFHAGPDYSIAGNSTALCRSTRCHSSRAT